jgi:transposase
VVFENFLYEVLHQLRSDAETKFRPIVVFLDNAKPHKSELITKLAKRMRVTFIYAAQYSPWMMPTE